MRKINGIITVSFGVLAILVWVYAYYCLRYWGVIWAPWPVYLALTAAFFAMIACLGWVLLTWQAARGDGETRCRKCRYILRGLSQPICPECGTPI